MLLHNLRHIPDPATAYKGLRRLRPGHAMIVRDGQIARTWRYWDVGADIARAKARAVDGAKAVREALEDAVELRRIAGVPVGALLSGGTDSSAIAALVQKHSGDQLRTYALGYDADDEDLVRARLMAKRLGTAHREFYFDPAEQWSSFRKISPGSANRSCSCRSCTRSSFARPYGPTAARLSWPGTAPMNCSRLSRPSPDRPAVADDRFTGGLVAPCRLGAIAMAAAAVDGAGGAARRTQGRALSGLCRKAVAASAFGQTAHEQVSEEMANWGRLGPREDYIDKSNFVALMVENCHSVTIATDLPAMLSAVEMRAPFLDQDMTALAFALSWRTKLPADGDPTHLKAILKTAVRDLVPDELLYAPKRGFGHGIQERDVLLGPWRGFVDRAFGDMPNDHWSIRNGHVDCGKVAKTAHPSIGPSWPGYSPSSPGSKVFAPPQASRHDDGTPSRNNHGPATAASSAVRLGAGRAVARHENRTARSKSHGTFADQRRVPAHRHPAGSDPRQRTAGSAAPGVDVGAPSLRNRVRRAARRARLQLPNLPQTWRRRARPFGSPVTQVHICFFRVGPSKFRLALR